MPTRGLHDTEADFYPIVGRQTLGDEGWQQNIGLSKLLDNLGFHGEPVS